MLYNTPYAHFFTFPPPAGLQGNSHNDSTAGRGIGHGVHQGSQHGAALYSCPMNSQPYLFTCSPECAVSAFCVALLSCYTLVPFTTQALSMNGSRPIVHTCPLVFLSACTEECCHGYLYAVLCISIPFGKCSNIDQCPPCWGTVLLVAVKYTAMGCVLSVVRITGTYVELYQHATHFVCSCTTPGPPRHKVRLVLLLTVEGPLMLWFSARHPCPAPRPPVPLTYTCGVVSLT